MNTPKEIDKNRQALIRHFIQLGKTRGESIGICAKSKALDLIGMDHCQITGRSSPQYPEIKTSFGLSNDQWHSMEEHYENWSVHGESIGDKRTFADTAQWLQKLPGWPVVL